MTIRTAAEFAQLRESDNPAEYQRAAKEDAPPEVWFEVIETFPRLRTWVAYNKSVPVEVLRVLAADPDPKVRWAVAIKRKLPLDLVEKLALDTDESVRARIAHHHRVTAAILRKLADDPSPVVSTTARARLADMKGI